MANRYVRRLALIAALLVTTPAVGGGQARAADATQYVGHLGGVTDAVAVQGGHAYLGAGFRLDVLDVANPHAPSLLGQTAPFPGQVVGLAMAGNDALVADGDGGLRVVDVSNPGQPGEVGAISAGTTVSHVAVSGHIAVVVAGSDLDVVDIADPAKPVIDGTLPLKGQLLDVATSGSWAYVAAESNALVPGPPVPGGFSVVDVSNPSAPRVAGVLPGSYAAVAVAGTTAYVAAADHALHVVSVADPARPAQIGSLASSASAHLAVSGTALYAGDGAVLRVIDVANPAQPALEGSYSVPGRFQIVTATAAAGTTAYLTDGIALRILDASNPRQPALAGTFLGPGHANGIAVDSHYAYLADGFSGGIHIVDMADPAKAAEVRYWDTHWNPRDLATAGHMLYATAGSAFFVVNVGDPTNPVLAGSVMLNRSDGSSTNLWGIALAGDDAYVADEGGGLQVIDIADPNQPRPVGSYGAAVNARGVALYGRYVFVAAGGGGLIVLDVSDPAHPTPVSTYPAPGASGIAIQGSLAYMVNGAGLLILDVANPARPTLVSSTSLVNASSIAVSGPFAYVTDTRGPRVLDVSDPAHPTLAGAYETAESPAAVVPDGADVAFAELEGGLLVLHQPGAPVATPLPHPERCFVQTGFCAENDAFWNYFTHRGGLRTFGYPTSREFTFQGFPVQFYQRQVMQRFPDGSIHLLNLLDPALLPYTSFNFSTFPSPDPSVSAQAPAVGSPDYANAVIRFVQQQAPDVWNGLPVRFYQTFASTVTLQDAFPSGGNPALLPAVNLELWGVPISKPAYDPHNRGFVYLRFQRGIMMFDTSCRCTHGVLMGDYLKDVIMGQHLPADLAREAAGSPFLGQYDPSQPRWVRTPDLLPDTDLTNGFTPQ